MQTLSTNLKTHNVYNGFTVIDVTQIEDYDAIGIYLRHNQTGLEVFHMLTDDNENLFSFAFKTLPSDSMGEAHILEHSVLCGSSKFPLKDPFVHLVNQSVKTFLNAMTFPDKTVFPASSMVEADYFNLMSVYGDAVFFPLLDEKIFSQEAHRLEIDKDGNLSIQGVVYNEMKGVYSSFENVTGDAAIHTLLPETPYAVDSGGDPAHIPELTYKDFRAYHAKNYSPSNCRIFLYGNIPTEKQLDFIAERFLAPFINFSNRTDNAFERSGVTDNIEADNIETENDGESCHHVHAVSDKSIFDSIPQYPPPVVFQKPQYFEAPAPDNGNNKSTIVESWLLGDSSDPVQYMEAVLLAEIILGHDGSPMTRALLECNLGEDIAPCTEINSEMRYITMSIGLRGVERDKARQVEDVVLSVIKNLCENGIADDDIASAVLAVEFSDREIKRGQGPYSLTLMRRSLRGWLYGKKPDFCLSNRKAFEQIKQCIKTDSNYVKSLLRRLFLENNHRVCLTVYPDKEYLKKTEDREKEMAALLASRLADDVVTGGKPVYGRANKSSSSRHDDIEKPSSSQENIESKATLLKSPLVSSLVENLQNDLKSFQQMPEDPEVVARIPHLKPSELTVLPEKTPVEYTELEGVPFFISREPVNGIVYIDVAFPIDTLSPMDYPLLPLFSTAATNSGFSGLDWAAAAARIALSTGGLIANAFTTSPVPLNGNSCYEIDSDLVGRDWLFYRIKILNEMTEKGVSLLFDCISSADFSDEKRMSDLAVEYKNDFDSSIVPCGNEYIASRATISFSRKKAVDEIWNGISQFYTARMLSQAKPSVLNKAFSRIAKTLLQSGAIFHVTADEEGVVLAEKALGEKIKQFGLCPPLKPSTASNEDFFALTALNESGCIVNLNENGFIEFNDKYVASNGGSSTGGLIPSVPAEKLTVFRAPSQIGYACIASHSSGYGSPELVQETVFAHLLTNTLLWEKIRTIGGAYGAFASPDGVEKAFLFVTYRDPNPLKSILVYKDCLEKMAETTLSLEQLEKAIAGSFSKEIQPRSPSARGFSGFFRKLHGMKDSDRDIKIKQLLAVTSGDIQNAANRLLSQYGESQKVVLCGKNKKIKEKTGIIIDLPL